MLLNHTQLSLVLFSQLFCCGRASEIKRRCSHYEIWAWFEYDTALSGVV